MDNQYDFQDEQIVDQVLINGEPENKPYYYIQSFQRPKQFMDQKNRKNTLNDYAFPKIKGEIEYDQYLKICCSFKKYSGSIAKDGYPGGQFSSQGEIIIACQKGLTKEDVIIGKQKNYDRKSLSYGLSTERGQSGAPVISYCDDKWQTVIAIHNCGVARFQQRYNMGRKITPGLISELQEWIRLNNQSQVRFIRQQDISMQISVEWQDKIPEKFTTISRQEIQQITSLTIKYALITQRISKNVKMQLDNPQPIIKYQQWSK